MILTLAEIFVLAACVEHPALQRPNDLSSLQAAGLLHGGRESPHCPVKDGSTLFEANQALLKEKFEGSGADRTTGQGGGHRVIFKLTHHPRLGSGSV